MSTATNGPGDQAPSPKKVFQFGSLQSMRQTKFTINDMIHRTCNENFYYANNMLTKATTEETATILSNFELSCKDVNIKTELKTYTDLSGQEKTYTVKTFLPKKMVHLPSCAFRQSYSEISNIRTKIRGTDDDRSTYKRLVTESLKKMASTETELNQNLAMFETDNYSSVSNQYIENINKDLVKEEHEILYKGAVAVSIPQEQLSGTINGTEKRLVMDAARSFVKTSLLYPKTTLTIDSKTVQSSEGFKEAVMNFSRSLPSSVSSEDLASDIQLYAETPEKWMARIKTWAMKITARRKTRWARLLSSEKGSKIVKIIIEKATEVFGKTLCALAALIGKKIIKNKLDFWMFLSTNIYDHDLLKTSANAKMYEQNGIDPNLLVTETELDFGKSFFSAHFIPAESNFDRCSAKKRSISLFGEGQIEPLKVNVKNSLIECDFFYNNEYVTESLTNYLRMVFGYLIEIDSDAPRDWISTLPSKNIYLMLTKSKLGLVIPEILNSIATKARNEKEELMHQTAFIATKPVLYIKEIADHVKTKKKCAIGSEVYYKGIAKKSDGILIPLAANTPLIPFYHIMSRLLDRYYSIDNSNQLDDPKLKFYFLAGVSAMQQLVFGEDFFKTGLEQESKLRNRTIDYILRLYDPQIFEKLALDRETKENVENFISLAEANGFSRKLQNDNYNVENDEEALDITISDTEESSKLDVELTDTDDELE